MIDEYNQGATAAWQRHERTDKATVLLKRDDLVRSTQDEMKKSLSSDGWEKLDAYIKGAKTHMKISGPGGKP